MLAGLMWVVRQRRYLAFVVLAAVVAIGCIAAGTWQISRFQESVHGNRALRANADAAPVALSPAVVPVNGPALGRLAVQYRTVRARGQYVNGADTFLTDQFHGGTAGFDVLTPLRTAAGTLLVDRGFIAADATGAPKKPPAAPTGTVTLVGRLNPGTSTAPKVAAGRLVSAVSVGAPSTYRAFLTLDKGQPGGQGLVAAPAPDQTNPYGGAYEWQHFAYIVQWYVFALLALLAPFFVARNEVREARRRWLGIDAGELEFDELTAGDAPADRARPELPAASPAALPARPEAALPQRAARVAPEQLEHARRSADRYGRSLGPHGSALFTSWRRSRRDLPPTAPVTDSSRTPHRSDDAYHAAYNDYLWQLAMADGDTPDVQIGSGSADDQRRSSH